jgi:hypothetical protein
MSWFHSLKSSGNGRPCAGNFGRRGATGDAAIPFENGQVSAEKLAEWNRLDAEVDEVKQRMDAFIAPVR